jgi:hypothetical protein
MHAFSRPFGRPPFGTDAIVKSSYPTLKLKGWAIVETSLRDEDEIQGSETPGRSADGSGSFRT